MCPAGPEHCDDPINGGAERRHPLPNHDRNGVRQCRIRNLKDTGATNLPLQAFSKNQIWLELAQLAVAGRIITTGSRSILRLSKRWPWTDLMITGHQRLAEIT